MPERSQAQKRFDMKTCETALVADVVCLRQACTRHVWWSYAQSCLRPPTTALHCAAAKGRRRAGQGRPGSWRPIQLIPEMGLHAVHKFKLCTLSFKLKCCCTQPDIFCLV